MRHRRGVNESLWALDSRNFLFPFTLVKKRSASIYAGIDRQLQSRTNKRQMPWFVSAVLYFVLSTEAAAPKRDLRLGSRPVYLLASSLRLEGSTTWRPPIFADRSKSPRAPVGQRDMTARQYGKCMVWFSWSDGDIGAFRTVEKGSRRAQYLFQASLGGIPPPRNKRMFPQKMGDVTWSCLPNLSKNPSKLRWVECALLEPIYIIKFKCRTVRSCLNGTFKCFHLYSPKW